jgi:hypothetical protein
MLSKILSWGDRIGFCICRGCGIAELQTWTGTSEISISFFIYTQYKSSSY